MCQVYTSACCHKTVSSRRTLCLPTASWKSASVAASGNSARRGPAGGPGTLGVRTTSLTSHRAWTVSLTRRHELPAELPHLIDHRFFSWRLRFHVIAAFCLEKLTLGMCPSPEMDGSSSISFADVFCLTSWVSRKSTANHLATSPSTLQMSQIVKPEHGWGGHFKKHQNPPVHTKRELHGQSFPQSAWGPPRRAGCTGFNTVGLRHH